jgi:hypothetical protein
LADATPLDAYANCFVRRHRPSSNLVADAPAPEPKAGLALRSLRRGGHDAEDA